MIARQSYRYWMDGRKHGRPHRFVGHVNKSKPYPYSSTRQNTRDKWRAERRAAR